MELLHISSLYLVKPCVCNLKLLREKPINVCNLYFMNFIRTKHHWYCNICFLFYYVILLGSTLPPTVIQPRSTTTGSDSTTPRQSTPRQSTVTRTESNVDPDDSDQGTSETTTTAADDSDQNGRRSKITTTTRSSHGSNAITHPEMPEQEDDGKHVNLFLAKLSQMFLFLNK